MERVGVFGMLSLELARDQVTVFERTRLVLPDGWPEAQLGTAQVPDAAGFLSETDPPLVEELLQQLGSRDDQYLGYALRRGGQFELDVYFFDYEAFHCWFYAYALMAWHASRLGAHGSGAFLWDDECPEPVLLEFTVADGQALVRAVDPQDSRDLLARTRARTDALVVSASRKKHAVT